MSSTLNRWRRKLDARRDLLATAERDYRAKPTAANRARLTLRRTQVSQAVRVVHRYRLTRTVSFDGVPVFYGLALILQYARDHGWGGVLNSADRRKGVAEKYGKLSQAALYAGWIAHKAGFNPANPPGRSTHELRSDGVPYRGPVGRPLSWWQLGLDLSDATGFDRAVKGLGVDVFRPYASGSEAHHRNLRTSPTKALRKKGLA